MNKHNAKKIIFSLLALSTVIPALFALYSVNYENSNNDESLQVPCKLIEGTRVCDYIDLIRD